MHMKNLTVNVVNRLLVMAAVVGLVLSTPVMAAPEPGKVPVRNSYQLEFTFDVSDIARGNVRTATVDIPNKVISIIESSGFVVDSFFDVSYEYSPGGGDRDFETEMVSLSLKAHSSSGNATQPGEVIGVVLEAMGCCKKHTHRGHVTVLK